MELKEIKIYQSVQFEGKQHTFFTHRNPEYKHIKMKMEDRGVWITSANDTVLVGHANIAYSKPVETPSDVKSMLVVGSESKSAKRELSK